MTGDNGAACFIDAHYQMELVKSDGGYSIPPSSPVYRVTYVKVVEAGNEKPVEIEAGAFDLHRFFSGGAGGLFLGDRRLLPRGVGLLAATGIEIPDLVAFC